MEEWNVEADGYEVFACVFLEAVGSRLADLDGED